MPDLTAGPHTVRVRYAVSLDEDDVFHPSFQMTEQATWFFTVRFVYAIMRGCCVVELPTK